MFVVLLMMLHPTQELEPSANPGRFTQMNDEDETDDPDYWVLEHNSVVEAHRQKYGPQPKTSEFWNSRPIPLSLAYLFLKKALASGVYMEGLNAVQKWLAETDTDPPDTDSDTFPRQQANLRWRFLEWFRLKYADGYGRDAISFVEGMIRCIKSGEYESANDPRLREALLAKKGGCWSFRKEMHIFYDDLSGDRHD